MTHEMLTFTVTTRRTTYITRSDASVKSTSGWMTDRASNTDGSTSSYTSTSPTTMKPASETDHAVIIMNPESDDGVKDMFWRSVVVVAGCGVAVGFILLVSAVLRNKRKAGSGKENKQEPRYANVQRK